METMFFNTVSYPNNFSKGGAKFWDLFRRGFFWCVATVELIQSQMKKKNGSRGVRHMPLKQFFNIIIAVLVLFKQCLKQVYV